MEAHLDSEFNRYLKMARGLLSEIKRSKDRDIVASFIGKCINLKGSDVEMKENRNEFFRYLLKMLHSAAENQPLQYNDEGHIEMKSKPEDRIMSFWSDDKKSYVSARIVQGFGALIYMATTDDPKKGWEHRGFEK